MRRDLNDSKTCYLRRRLASGEGIVALGVRVRVCVSAEPRLHAVGGEGNAMYPVLSSYYCDEITLLSKI